MREIARPRSRRRDRRVSQHARAHNDPGERAPRGQLLARGRNPPWFGSEGRLHRTGSEQSTTALPRPLTRFIGSPGKIGRIAEIIMDCRLTTLTGPGGCGKTRLAIETASHMASSFEYVWFVDLSLASGSAEVNVAVAHGVGLPFLAEPGSSELLAAKLRGRRSLLVLDNCEQVVGACGKLLSIMLPRCPRLHVLTTSREPLGVDRRGGTARRSAVPTDWQRTRIRSHE